MDQALDFASIIPTITRFARGLTRSSADADDLVQMTCERALTRTEQWQPGTRLDSWACRIMRTVWLNEIRARHTRGRHMSAYGAERQDDQHDGEREAEATLDLRRAVRGLSHLSTAEQTLVSLVCLEGQTYREAAQQMDIPIGTVMSRLSRIRDKLNAGVAKPARAPKALARENLRPAL
jgi:RNA polymerase sigma-70 factor (ECF subfamily)